MSHSIRHPLVSVILPVYNGADYVAATVESAQRQTYEHLEIIAVDDGSTDETLKVLERYAAEDSRIRVISQQNGGVARARNRGLAEAKGELIAPLDADDLWAPDKIARQVRQMELSGAGTGLVYSWWVWIDAAGVILDRSPAWAFEGDVFERLLEINFTGNASVPLFRRHCIEEAGGYNEDMAANHAGGCEDWELVLRIAERYNVSVVTDPLMGYRRRPGSMSTACETMARSQRRMMRSMQALRPNLDPSVVSRATAQFNLYLSGLSFWSGNLGEAVRWALQAGVRLPLRVTPHVVKMLLTRQGRKKTARTMLPGVALNLKDLPAPFLPYDRIYTD